MSNVLASTCDWSLMYTDKQEYSPKMYSWKTSHKRTGDCKNFGVIPVHFPEVWGQRDLNSSPRGVPIVLDQNHVVWIKACVHAFPRHFVSNDERFLLLPLDGKQHSVSYFANAVLGVDVDHSWRSVVGCISKRAVVHHTHSGHFLNRRSNRWYTDRMRRKEEK